MQAKYYNPYASDGQFSLCKSKDCSELAEELEKALQSLAKPPEEEEPSTPSHSAPHAAADPSTPTTDQASQGSSRKRLIMQTPSPVVSKKEKDDLQASCEKCLVSSKCCQYY